MCVCVCLYTRIRTIKCRLHWETKIWEYLNLELDSCGLPSLGPGKQMSCERACHLPLVSELAFSPPVSHVLQAKWWPGCLMSWNYECVSILVSIFAHAKQLNIWQHDSWFMHVCTHLITHCEKIGFFTFRAIFRNNEKTKISTLYNYINNSDIIYSFISIIIWKYNYRLSQIFV
jgi:hypothetical protein